MKSRGVTLIMVAGVLAILSAMGAGFYTLTIMQSKAAMRYSDSVRAEIMARAGINDAMARMREQLYQKTEDPSDLWYTADYLHGAQKRISFAAKTRADQLATDPEPYRSFSRALSNSAQIDSDRYSLSIVDASSKININACDNLGFLLDNLCRVIGAPLISADLDTMQPAVWSTLGAAGFDKNKDDISTNLDIYYKADAQNRPTKLNADGSALYGDGYAIAGYRSHLKGGRFLAIEDIKDALTYLSRPGHPELEQLERELKFKAIRDYITVDSWIDLNTVCVGKFEWIDNSTSGASRAIDRDKSWVADDPADTAANNSDKLDNHRGSLRGCYVSIINGHGAGQLRRIKTNGIDWIQVEPPFLVNPGPISSYMIVAKEDAMTDSLSVPLGGGGQMVSIELPREDQQSGALVDNPAIDYTRWPLCIHRAPVNINTASDKVLESLFLGIGVSAGHYQSIGTDVDVNKTYAAWYLDPDPLKLESRSVTGVGVRRLPQSTGKIVYDQPIAPIQTLVKKTDSTANIDYLNNYGAADPKKTTNVTEAHDLAMRVMSARQRKVDPKTGKIATSDIDPFSTVNGENYERGPFKSWDDFYFRVVRIWDEKRFLLDQLRGRAAPMIMAHFNSNTDVLKFNPGIEWIDRWGRNFTEMEPVMCYDDTPNPGNPRQLTAAIPRSGGYVYITRNLRYKADEMIDKTDLNRSTTEFCFDSGGIYEIQSTGQVVKDGEVRSERKFEALVQIYDVWRETTQRQFVQGTLSSAANQAIGANNATDQLMFNYSGKVARDSQGFLTRRALDTQPEPLVPLNYTIPNQRASGAQNVDVVDSSPAGHDCFGRVKGSIYQPDVIANKVMPATWDGQIVLATNTASYTETAEQFNTFLASFNGDLDTNTSVGNGREQAKSPGDRTTRVLDTCSLLGVLGDNDPRHIDFDQQDGRNGNYMTFAYAPVNAMLRPLNVNSYWENVTVRQSDLRPEGVFLNFVGVSGNDGTLKYLIDVDNVTGRQNCKRKNFNPEDGAGATNGATICMWFKPNWHADDLREHEFFNATGPGTDYSARYCILSKYGRLSWLMNDGVRLPQASPNDLLMGFEDRNDGDERAYLYGGATKESVLSSANNVTVTNTAQVDANTAGFYTQPFRWGFVGGIMTFNYNVGGAANTGYGWGTSSAAFDTTLEQVCRPFISTQKNPETPKSGSVPFVWKDTYYQTEDSQGNMQGCDFGSFGGFTGGTGIDGTGTQAAVWDWADGGNQNVTAPNNQGVFGMNNLNRKTDQWLYRGTPIDGTLAVVDEFKLSKKAWTHDQIYNEQTTSRYYLPTDANGMASRPFFTSQTMLQSIKGTKAAAVTSDSVTLARVAWTVFTPRFLYENKDLSTRVPFDYFKYNPMKAPLKGQDITNENDPGWTPYGCFRPSLSLYKKRYPGKPSQASSGVEIELQNGGSPITGGMETSPGVFTKVATFTDPDVFNRVGDPQKPVTLNPKDLRYLVHFKYPIDNNFGGGVINMTTQYMLDTPVFDDISITYFRKPTILAFKEISE